MEVSPVPRSGGRATDRPHHDRSSRGYELRALHACEPSDPPVPALGLTSASGPRGRRGIGCGRLDSRQTRNPPRETTSVAYESSTVAVVSGDGTARRDEPAHPSRPHHSGWERVSRPQAARRPVEGTPPRTSLPTQTPTIARRRQPIPLSPPHPGGDGRFMQQAGRRVHLVPARTLLRGCSARDDNPARHTSMHPSPGSRTG